MAQHMRSSPAIVMRSCAVTSNSFTPTLWDNSHFMQMTQYFKGQIIGGQYSVSPSLSTGRHQLVTGWETEKAIRKDSASHYHHHHHTYWCTQRRSRSWCHSFYSSPSPHYRHLIGDESPHSKVTLVTGSCDMKHTTLTLPPPLTPPDCISNHNQNKIVIKKSVSSSDKDNAAALLMGAMLSSARLHSL